jgi:hypothetical protein
MKVVRNKTFPESASTSTLNSVIIGGPPSLGATSICTLPKSFVGSNTECNPTAATMGGTVGGIDALTILQQLLSGASAATSNVTDSANNESLMSSASAFPGEGDRNLSLFHQMMPPQQHQGQLSLQTEAISALPPANLLPVNIPPQQSQQTAQAQASVSAFLSLFCGTSPSLPQQQQQPKPQINDPSPPVRNAGSDNDENSDSNTRSLHGSGDGGVDKFDPLIFKARALREEALRRGSRILLCRARGMPMNHSANVRQLRCEQHILLFRSSQCAFPTRGLPQTAFFEVPANAAHGEELLCSHPRCRQGRIKFLLCKYCDEPVAKRSFRTNHDHKDLVALEPKLTSQNSVRQKTDDDVSERKPRARKRRKVDVKTFGNARANKFTGPLATLAAAAAAGVEMPQSVGGGVDSFQMKSGCSDTSSFSASTEHRPSDGGDSNNSSTEDDQNDDALVVPAGQEDRAAGQLKAEWCELLDARRAVETAEDMSAWLMRVFSVSQRCVTGRNHNISDDDDMNMSDQTSGKESSIEQRNESNN